MKQNHPTYSIKKNRVEVDPLSIPTTKGLLFEAYFGLVRSLLHHGRSIPRQIQQLPACGVASTCLYRVDAIALRALSGEGTLEPHSGLAKKPVNLWDELCMNWCRISGINSRSNMVILGAGVMLAAMSHRFSITLVQQRI